MVDKLHCDTKSKHFIVLFSAGIIRDNHPVGDDDTRAMNGRREESERMARVHNKRLLFSHIRQIMHDETKLEQQQQQ